jgi:hyaluronoglucosaminidase
MAKEAGRMHTGVVEGFYGRPWSHRDRLDMIRFLGENGFNMYVYAPKDDSHIRSRWRGTYPRSYIEGIRQLSQAAARSSVDFVFTLSPGLDFVYSKAGDRRVLLDRLTAVIEQGCKWVGVLLDDIPTKLVRAEDRKAFSSLGEAHASLLNAIVDGLANSGDVRLLFCPTYYANEYLGRKVGENQYLEEVGTSLDPRVGVFWTGRHVVSTRITEKDVRGYEAVVRRKPFLWDNYPVNDYYRSGGKKDKPRLNLGPFKGRDPEILAHLEGYVANPMNEPEASKIPLLTLSEYIHDPVRYSPEASFESAARQAFSAEKCHDGISLLLDCSRANPLDPTEAEGLRDLVRQLTEATTRSGWVGAAKDLRLRFQAYVELKERLSACTGNNKLLAELDPVLDKIHGLALLGVGSLDLAERVRFERPSEREVRALRAQIRKQMHEVRRTGCQVLGEISFELGTAVEKSPDKDSVSDLGLPMVERESPIVRLCLWSMELSSSTGRNKSE